MASSTARSGLAEDSDWPGRRLGLPAVGARSVGRFGRRLAAVLIDWAIAVVISAVFFAYDPLANLGIFALIQIVSITIFAGSPGHLSVGLRVVPLSGGWIGVLRPLARTLMLCLVIPVAVTDSDQRGLHDRLAGTVLVRR